MSYIIFNEQRIDLDPDQTVLTALLSHGYEIPNNCRAGVCQSCMMRALEGQIPARAQQGLKDTYRDQGYFLACSCTPETPLHVTNIEVNALRCQATVVDHRPFAKDILHLRLTPDQAFDYRAGQYITVWKNSYIGRNYSLASVAELDDSIELHIRRVPGGIISNWLHDEVKIGDKLSIQSATGSCFYLPGSTRQNILLAGTGTGLAPLIGIARDALSQGHQGNIHLVHGARQVDELYLHETLVDMALSHRQFHYYANVLEAEQVMPPISMDSLEQQVMQVANQPADWRIYLCGDERIVNILKRNLFIAGASMENIYTDPFISASNVCGTTA